MITASAYSTINKDRRNSVYCCMKRTIWNSSCSKWLLIMLVLNHIQKISCIPYHLSAFSKLFLNFSFITPQACPRKRRVETTSPRCPLWREEEKERKETRREEEKEGGEERRGERDHKNNISNLIQNAHCKTSF